jgi:hypothetical protein
MARILYWVQARSRKCEKCLNFFYFQPNLATLPHGLSPLQVHHKNENKNPAYLNEFSSSLEGLGGEKLSSSFVYSFRGGFLLCGYPYFRIFHFGYLSI